MLENDEIHCNWENKPVRGKFQKYYKGKQNAKGKRKALNTMIKATEMLLEDIEKILWHR